jgi:epoxide hydrolase-like predicted phosphatase
MIKYIIFDNGGVLVQDDWLDFINKLKSLSPQTASEVLIKEAEATKGSFQLNEFVSYLSPIIDKFGLNYDPLKPNEICLDVVNIISQIPKQYKTGMLTNEFSTFDLYDKKWHFSKLFNGLIFASSKIGYRKPDPNIYKYMLEKLACLPSEVVFIDDREKNVEAATNLGIKGIIFKDAVQLKKELFNLLENDEK